ISAVPDLAGEIDLLEQLIQDTAVHPTFGGQCGIAAGQFPNHTFGHGRIDALAAVQAALALAHTLDVALAGSGVGVVTSSPAGIDCPGDCEASFLTGAEVTLSAVAADGSH